MLTRVLKMGLKKPEKAKLQEAAMILKNGGLVAFPTETVYGLGANALNPKAVKKIFQAKGRPADNPLIIHIASMKELKPLVTHIPSSARKLMEKFWPGPLTLLFKKSAIVPKIATGGLSTVAVRMPAHKVACALIKAAKMPIAAPSANLSGTPSPTDASHVLHDFDGKIDMILDGGKTHIGLESTVIDMMTSPPTILRPGKISRGQIEKVIGGIAMHTHTKLQPDEIVKVKSPGMKYRHYAPKAKVILVDGSKSEKKKKINALITHYKKQGKKVAVMTLDKNHGYSADAVKYMGATHASIARRLFSTLRDLDHRSIDIILIETVPEKGLGAAIMNRLRRAAEE